MAAESQRFDGHLVRVEPNILSHLEGAAKQKETQEIIQIISRFYRDFISCCIDPRDFSSRGDNASNLLSWIIGDVGGRLDVISPPYRFVVEKRHALDFVVVEIGLPH